MISQAMDRELVFILLQFLEEEKYYETARRLERESGVFFNMRYFEACVKNGEWDEVEKYLSGFMRVEDNRHCMKIFFEIRKQKYLEALDKHDNARALDILTKELKSFFTINEDLFKELTLLLTVENFRENERLSNHGDIVSARVVLFGELKKLIESNPILSDKLQFPSFKNARLITLLNQSCGGLSSNGAQGRSPLPVPSMGGHVPKDGGLPPSSAHGHFHPTPTVHMYPTAWMTSGSVPHHTVPKDAASLRKHHRTPINNMAVEYQSADSEHPLKRPRHFGISEEVNNVASNSLPVTYPGQSQAHSSYSSDDLPKTVAVILNQGSAIKSMVFHPVQPTLLLVGTNIGDIALWEVRSRERLILKKFKVSNLGACSVALQVSLVNDYTASVNRVVWSPDGALFGVAYSKHIVQIYSYHGGDDLQIRLEIDAHVGNVSDLTFCHPNKQLCIITCGEDKTIKVWDAITGNKQYTFSGHEAPVYSVCPHQRGNVQFIFSTDVDGKIKAWLYDTTGSRVDYNAPGQSYTTMAYSTDGTRLFSCGTSKGQSYMVEWNESEGSIKRIYHGLGKQSIGVVQFDTTKNHYLAVGDEFQIKFWNMDNANLLSTVDADGGLPASPCIRFNKEGTLLATSTSDNCIKILANADGIRLFHSSERRALDTSRAASGNVSKVSILGTFGASSSAAGLNAEVAERCAPLANVVGQNGDSRSLLPDLKPSIADLVKKYRISKLTEINESYQLQSLKLPDGLLPTKIVRMIYTNSGNAILALGDNAIHKLWKWERTERNPSGKATTSAEPVIWQPNSGILMTNDTSHTNVENSVPCFALSKNDSYVTSSSGGKISLFNMMTFKTMATFMTPPPSPTSIAFHPRDNNIITIGMEDSSIYVYNARLDQVQRKLMCHQKRVTGLAFSNALNVLVSSGADAQLCVWDMEGWEKLASTFLKIPSESVLTPLAPTRVQFHQDQTQLLAVHGTQIAIYKAPKLELLKQWNTVSESGGSISDATYSCDGQSIYASLEDGSVTVLTASTLQQRCLINLDAYLPSSPDPSLKVYPVVIAANPTQANQLALGLSNGDGVYVLELVEAERK